MLRGGTADRRVDGQRDQAGRTRLRPRHAARRVDRAYRELPRAQRSPRSRWASRSRRCRRRTWRSCAKLPRPIARATRSENQDMFDPMSSGAQTRDVEAGAGRYRGLRQLRRFYEEPDDFGRFSSSRPRRSPRTRREVLVIGHQGSGPSSGVGVGTQSLHVWTFAAAAHSTCEYFPTAIEALKAAGPLGVGDVAGERGDRAAGYEALAGATEEARVPRRARPGLRASIAGRERDPGSSGLNGTPRRFGASRGLSRPVPRSPAVEPEGIL